jgi:hypothetical protein
MKVSFFLALCLVFTACAGAQTGVQSKQENGKYTVYMSTGGGTKVIVSGLPREPAIIRINDKLFKITVSLGNPDSYTYFANTSTQKVDGPFFLFQKLNERNLEILYVGSDGKLTSKILFSNSKPISYELPDVSPVAVVTNAITSISFMSDNSIRITYYTGPDFVEKEIILH